MKTEELFDLILSLTIYNQKRELLNFIYTMNSIIILIRHHNIYPIYFFTSSLNNYKNDKRITLHLPLTNSELFQTNLYKNKVKNQHIIQKFKLFVTSDDQKILNINFKHIISPDDPWIRISL